MSLFYNNIYNKRKIFLTGHTGFKGSWLSLFLSKLGAQVSGYSLAPNTSPAHYNLLGLTMKSYINDIRDYDKLLRALQHEKPEIVFHLAAQPLVLDSYKEPVYTYNTNLIGTLNLLEACKQIESIKAIVIITTDKVYKNKEWYWPYRETDRLGGYDPYSSSKACVEIMTDSFVKSFYNIDEYNLSHNKLLATVRAGNVIGGGDWSDYRLIPDICKAIHKNEKLNIRNPSAIRPWQHVLDPLSGYLYIGQKLYEGDKESTGAWNIGPSLSDIKRVDEIIKIFFHIWKEVECIYENQEELKHEANQLKLDCSKIETRLKWKPVWDVKKSIEYTANWYKSYYEEDQILSSEDIDKYLNNAVKMNVSWYKKNE